MTRKTYRGGYSLPEKTLKLSNEFENTNHNRITVN